MAVGGPVIVDCPLARRELYEHGNAIARKVRTLRIRLQVYATPLHVLANANVLLACSARAAVPLRLAIQGRMQG